MFPASRRVYRVLRPLITTRWEFPSYPERAAGDAEQLLRAVQWGSDVDIRRAWDALDEWLLTTDAQDLSREQSCVVGCALLECLVYTLDVPRDIVSVSPGVRHAFRVFGAKDVRGLAEVLHVVSRLKRRRGPELRGWEVVVLRAAEATLSAIIRGSVGERERAVAADPELNWGNWHTPDIRSEIAACECVDESVRRWLLDEVWVE